ncbi:MAG: pyrroline-5-carboxylate reductase [Gammaproteobacteria bacterium]|nr:pyrroline-5-carboxylate reductase [Gammaproteobacteria bacterium]
MTSRVAILGCGHMGSAIAHGIMKTDALDVSLIVADPNLNKLEQFSKTTTIATNDNTVAVRNADTVFLVVKPHDVQTALKECAEHLDDKLIISVAAGVPFDRLSDWLPTNTPIVRCMPNTPSLIGAGVAGVFANAYVTSHQREFVDTLLQSMGQVVWLSTEDQLHVVTAISGSGPAYFFYIMEAMIQAGCKLELDRTTAEQLVVETAYGAANMVRTTRQAPQTLKEQAETPGGTTIAAMASLDNENVQASIATAIEEACARSVKITKEF